VPRRKEVDAWFARYDNPMKPVVRRIREIVLGADGRMDECIKWQAPTFTYRGNLASFFPKSKQHASLMFHTGAHIPGHHPRLEGGGNTGRMLKLGSVADANSAKREIEQIVRAWCDWRDSSGMPSAGAKSNAKKTGARRGATSAKAAKGTASPRSTGERPPAKRAGRAAKTKRSR
jgi:hypothetical protein